MNRLFNRKQRIALVRSAGFQCTNCGKPLDLSFHADHIHPYSKGGETDVINGQALCPTCNLKKGNKLMSKIKLRDWQARGLNATLNALETKDFFLAQATPGGGKTIFGLSVFTHGGAQLGVDKIVVLAPSSHLVEQWAEEAKKVFGLELKSEMLYQHAADFHEYDGMVGTYQWMASRSEDLRLFCNHNRVLVLCDEMHHLADGKSWGDSFQNGFEFSKKVVALTGTPWASAGQRIPRVTYDNDGYALPDFTYGKKQAIRDQVCRVVEFSKMKPRDLEFIDVDTGEFIGEYSSLDMALADKVPGAYLKTLQSIKHMRAMFIQADEQLTHLRASGVSNAGGLLVAPDIATAHKFKDEIYALTGEDYPIVHSKMVKPHEKIKAFRNSNERWLISVDMVTEGVDIKRLQVLVFLSQKNTELFFRQVTGRIERVIRPDDYLDRTAYFYYTDTVELSELIKKLEDENQAGLAALEEELKLKIDRESTGGMELIPNGVTLKDVDTARSGLIANGFDYSEEVTQAALKMKRSHKILADLELFVVCKMVIAQNERVEEIREHQIAKRQVPLNDQKKRLKSRIHKLLCSKLTAYYGRKPTGDEIKDAHNNLNRFLKVDYDRDSRPMDQLERKLDYITQTKAETWPNYGRR